MLPRSPNWTIKTRKVSLINCSNLRTQDLINPTATPPSPTQLQYQPFKDKTQQTTTSSKIQQTAIAMKKLYKKGTAVHPTPPLISDHLSFLPPTILTLTLALSPQDRQVLAYLISCSSTNFSGGSTPARIGGADHPTSFNCYCFRCYMSYWIRWDSSPNRQLIHEIIDAFEDSLLMVQKNTNKKEKGKKERRKGNKGSAKKSGELKISEQSSNNKEEINLASDSVVESSSGCGDVTGGDRICQEEEEKSSVRRFVSFIGEKIWGTVWN